jgi:XTP/dITP diphosphohydrolase
MAALPGPAPAGGPDRTDGSSGAGAAVDRLVEVIAALRARCPWMGALTHTSLVQYLVEETYELVDALEALDGAGNPAPGGAGRPGAGVEDDLRGELGDVLLQVVLHARLQQEQGRFGLREVAEGLTDKMVRRNPHVFRADGSLRASPDGGAGTEEIVRTWQAVKQRESPGRSSPFDGIPRHLPALASAVQSLRRADALAPAAGSSAGPARFTEESLGEALFALAREGASQGLDPEQALRAAVRRFQARSGGPD